VLLYVVLIVVVAWSALAGSMLHVIVCCMLLVTLPSVMLVVDADMMSVFNDHV